MNSLKTQGKQFINNREGRAEGGRGKPARFELKKRYLQHNLGGNGAGEQSHREDREKNVDVTVGLTDSCVEKQRKKPWNYVVKISKRRLSRDEPTGGKANRITVEIS